MWGMGWLTNIKKLLDPGTGDPSEDDDAPPESLPVLFERPPRPWQDDNEPDDVRMASYPSPDVGLERLARTVPNTIPLGIEDEVGWVEGRIGTRHGQFQVTHPDHHVLAIAPSRSAIGKTASLIIPSIVTHQGPVVVATIKPDVLPATAMARAQHGELWCYCPDGNTSAIPPGARELRWSPMSGAADLDVAVRTAKAMVKTVETNNVTGGDHWRKKAAQMLAPVFQWAALTGRTMHEARNLVYRGVGEDLENVWRDLRDRHCEDAAAMLQSVLKAGREEKNSIASTAGAALEGYDLSGALRSTENENFDADDFVNGGPFGMRADTLYITSSSDDQQAVAPLVVGLLHQIERAAYRRHRILIQKGDITTADGQVFPFRLGGVGAVPTLFALDELYGLAPLPNLPHLLSAGGSQGILVAAAVQELSMLKVRWPEAPAFISLFGHVLVFPGLRDDDTLETVLSLLGTMDFPVTTEQFGPQENYYGKPIKGEPWEAKSRTTQTHHRRVNDHSEVSRGPLGPDAVYHFKPGGQWGMPQMLPYWRSGPWPAIFSAYVERAVSGRVPAWRYWEAERSGERPPVPDVLPGLPVPDLRTWAEWAVRKSEYPLAREWGERFQRAVATREVLLSQGGDRLARYEIPRDNADTWSVTRRDAVPPPRPRAQGAQGGTPPRGEGGTPPAIGSTRKDSEMPSTHGGWRRRAAARRPEPILPFEATWGPDDEAMMRALRPGDPQPARYLETARQLGEALAVESTRRREEGDHASIDRFDRTRPAIFTAVRNDPALQARFLQERNDEEKRGEDHGWWKWMAPPLMWLFQAYLRGEDMDAVCDEALAAVGLAPEPRQPPPSAYAPGNDPPPARPVWHVALRTQGGQHPAPPRSPAA